MNPNNNTADQTAARHADVAVDASNNKKATSRPFKKHPLHNLKSNNSAPSYSEHLNSTSPACMSWRDLLMNELQ